MNMKNVNNLLVGQNHWIFDRCKTSLAKSVQRVRFQVNPNPLGIKNTGNNFMPEDKMFEFLYAHHILRRFYHVTQWYCP